MSENKTTLLPDVIKPVSDAIHQSIPETEKQTDGVLSTVVGFFNNVVLYPVKKANITFQYKLELFEEDLKEKVKNIPNENLQIPPTMIAGPTLEALRYTYDEKVLREMYENLLVSAMDNRKVSQAHPSFVDAIKQMSSLDASILSKVSKSDRLACANIRFSISGSNQEYSKGMPNYFVEELYEFADPFLVSTSLNNLDRLGLIRIIQGSLKGVDYQKIKLHPYVLERKGMFEKYGESFECKLSEYAIELTNYGQQFVDICI